MGRLFDMDNKFFTFMSRVADLCILNVLCIIFCIPVITAGASAGMSILSFIIIDHKSTVLMDHSDIEVFF